MVPAKVVGVVESNLLEEYVRGVVDNLEGIDQPVANLGHRSGKAVVSCGPVGPWQRGSAGNDALVQRTGKPLAYEMLSTTWI